MSNTCGLCERNETDDYLCPGCTKATLVRLERMPRMYEALLAFLPPAGRRPELGSASPVEAPWPVAEPVLNLRGPGGMVSILEDWRSAMQADRGWGQPAVTGSTEKRVAAAARGLVMNLEWIAASWSMAGAFSTEIRGLERDVMSVVSPPERTIRLGLCPHPVNDTPCGAVLRVPPGMAVVSCRWCGTDYPATRWYALAQAQDDLEVAS